MRVSDYLSHCLRVIVHAAVNVQAVKLNPREHRHSVLVIVAVKHQRLGDSPSAAETPAVALQIQKGLLPAGTFHNAVPQAREGKLPVVVGGAGVGAGHSAFGKRLDELIPYKLGI